MDPSAPGEVREAGFGWPALAFAPLALVAIVILALVVQPWPLAPLARAVRASPAQALVFYSFLSIAHAVAFSLHVHRNERVPHRSRMGWVAAFAFASPVAAPFYWFKVLAAPHGGT